MSSVRDAAALKKIEETIHSYYLLHSYGNELALLLAVSNACELHCSAEVQAKTWMYVGLYYGAVHDAGCAFERAFEWDPAVELDADLAMPAVKEAFAAARTRVCGEVT